uniref:Actin-like protein ARP6 n=1 Tax=Schizophyllum commune (strain H4-8 / FGSC 9210) TaxID=578458 RepID=D8PXN0_SCHCM
MDSPVVILDNGGYTVKAGVVGVHPEPLSPRIVPNAVIRSKGDKETYVGHEYARCSDFSSLHFRLPIEKGFVTDWDAQKAVWDGVFSKECLNVDTQQSTLLLTEPYFNLPNLQRTYDQFIFEEYEFRSYCRRTPASLVPYGSLFAQPGLPPPECSLILDCGFSFSHAIPAINGHVQWNAVRRVDVGGKLLTNHLKELVSFRQWNMMDQTVVMNHVKETCCFVSLDFAQDLERARHDRSTTLSYVLPDLTKSPHGHVKSANDINVDGANDMDVLLMGNERFSVPELLFTPSDIGLDQAGIAHAVASSIGALPDDLQGMFWANIGLVGGCTKFKGFRERLMLELERLAPTDCEVVIYDSDDPITVPYHGAHAFASAPDFDSHTITRASYFEHGSQRHDDDWRPLEAYAQAKGRVRRDTTSGTHEEGDDGGEGGGGGDGQKDTGDDERTTESEASEASSEESAPRKRRKSLRGEGSRGGRGEGSRGGGRGRGGRRRRGAAEGALVAE